jgi:hypothetical protein
MFQVHSKVVQNEMAFFDPSKSIAAKEIKVDYSQTKPIQLNSSFVLPHLPDNNLKMKTLRAENGSRLGITPRSAKSSG